MNILGVVFVVFLVAFLISEIWLGLRHIKHVKKNRNKVPEEFADKITIEEHQKSANYTIIKKKFALLMTPIAAILILIWTLGGGFEFFDNYARSFELSPIWTGILFLFLVGFIMNLLDIPSSIYETFVIEEKFGFNKTSVKVFINDLIKGWILSLVIGIPLLWVVLWLMNNSGEFWWLWVWGTWFGFSLLMMWIYPTLIAPLFNKFTPLKDQELKQVIDNLLSRCGFSNNGVFIMDGSKRSGHGNAYFTGFGKSKRIVFFDTLLKSLNPSEVEAVLAHELGHFKHNHIKKRMLVMAIVSLVGLWFLSFLINQDWFYQGLGMTTPSSYAALILFVLVMPIFMFFISPISSWSSRKHEYEADSFAVKNSNGNSLISALVNLYKDNASTLTPDPIHSLVYDSHPPAPLRIKNIKNSMA